MSLIDLVLCYIMISIDLLHHLLHHLKIQTHPLSFFIFYKDNSSSFCGFFPRQTRKIKPMCLTFQCDCEVHKDQRRAAFKVQKYFSSQMMFFAVFSITFKLQFCWKAFLLFKRGPSLGIEFFFKLLLFCSNISENVPVTRQLIVWYLQHRLWGQTHQEKKEDFI